MDLPPPLVVKVSYGGVLRRFRVFVKPNGLLDLDMAGLMETIAALFNLPLDAEFSMTYSDEDGDVVALVDDNDLFNVANQDLKFLKIDVQLTTGMSINSTASESSGSSSGSFVSMEVPFTGEKKGASKGTQTGKNPVDLNVPTVGFTDSKTSGHAPTSSGMGASLNECPFSGTSRTLNDSSPNTIRIDLNDPPACHYKKSSNGAYRKSLGLFHKGIRCDGCGVIPITGPRFNSKTEEYYGLCSICFSEMGNEENYTRMDKPVSAQHKQPFRGQHTQFSMGWPPCQYLNIRCTRPKLDSHLVIDLNVKYETVVAPSVPFTKIWKMRNNGSMVWPSATQIVWTGGERLSSSESIDLKIPAEGVPINSELDVRVDFVAPKSPGRYSSYWRMASSNGTTFGQNVWVLIHVDASLKGSVVNESHRPNLNFSPDALFIREFTGIDVNHEAAQLDKSSVNPGTVEGADLELEADESQIPEKDDMLVGEVDSDTPSWASYYIPELSESSTFEDFYGGSSCTKDITYPLEEDKENNEVEIKMVKELEEEIDLNKEILRDNEYNLEQTVVALLEVTDWDPILEELHEMGFCDDVTNKKLLKLYNRSVIGVVMDLLNVNTDA